MTSPFDAQQRCARAAHLNRPRLKQEIAGTMRTIPVADNLDHRYPRPALVQFVVV